MIDFEKQVNEMNGYRDVAQAGTAVTSVFRQVYGWMSLGLAISGLVAWWTASSGAFATLLKGPGWTICVIAELVMVLALSAMISKLPVPVLCAMFLGYSVLNGLTLSLVFIVYDLALIQRVFFITAAMFGGLALWGTFTKENLSGIGSMCMMALWGLIVACIVNIFMKSSQLDWVISLVGVIVFSGLTMYDAQKIKHLAAAESAMDRDSVRRIALAGALELYLDFVNLFLNLLRLMSRRK